MAIIDKKIFLSNISQKNLVFELFYVTIVTNQNFLDYEKVYYCHFCFDVDDFMCGFSGVAGLSR